ncbi:MAG: protein kinase [Myxococcota bacterium]
MSAPLETGDVVLGLEVLGELGRGGFARVYLVRREDGDELLALKVMHAKHLAGEATVARFLREAEVVSRLKSERIPRVLDVGTLPAGNAFILMEHLEGQTLAHILRDGALDPARAVRMASQLCEALEPAHAEGVLHRDLKPENVFVCDPGSHEEVKILDFGVATFVAGHTDHFGPLTKTSSMVGTPHYMSPEQIHARALEATSDLYMVGVLLYEMLSGRRPYDADTLGALLMQIQTGTRPPIHELAPQTPLDLIAIVDRALAHEPQDRFESAEALRHALDAADLSPPPPEALLRRSAETPMEPAPRKGPSLRLAAAVFGVGVVLAGAAIGATLGATDEEVPAAEPPPEASSAPAEPRIEPTTIAAPPEETTEEPVAVEQAAGETVQTRRTMRSERASRGSTMRDEPAAPAPSMPSAPAPMEPRREPASETGTMETWTHDGQLVDPW